MSENRRFGMIFDDAMKSMSTNFMIEVLQSYKGFENVKVLVDVGGGVGATLNMIISKYPSIKGINFDLPQVIKTAPSWPGVEHIEGNMFKSVPKGDAFVIKRVLHDWSDEMCTKILKSCLEVLPDYGKVIVIEVIVPESTQEVSFSSRLALTLDLKMFTLTPGGKGRTEKQYETLAKTAGFAASIVACRTQEYCVIEFYKNLPTSDRGESRRPAVRRMKRKTLKRSNRNRRRKEGTSMKNSLSRHLTVQLGQAAAFQQQQQQHQHKNLLDADSNSALDFDADAAPNLMEDRDFILSQDFFCTPDYITPDAPAVLDFNSQESIPCPKSPEKVKTTVKSKRQRLEGTVEDSFTSDQISGLPIDTLTDNETGITKAYGSEKIAGYVSQSAVALRCRVMPPPCIKNPYNKDASGLNIDPFDNHRSKCAGLYPAVFGGDGLSRYRADFHEIEKIGDGNFSCVFKVLKRIDGCMYAVKHSTRQLYNDAERRRALMEVQALAALGSHQNIVGYYSSWFENEKLYIQMELCDHSLSISRYRRLLMETEVLEIMHQIAKALQFIHERGIAHLDVKPDNIYVKNGVYKLGDFGCATLLDQSLPIEEGDARYMPQEILNEKYDCLDKVDIFSLGVTIYEIVRGSALPESGPHLLNLREGKLPLLPGHSVQFQNLLRVMMDPDPNRRPSARELLDNPIFDRALRVAKTK
ncbi:OLC1v1004259C1 [Oldenlandia corymbosa var. corymbosa]|nr:OLC1v1004259C1 [Oldenlandia corymbosa var. corymbosa]